MAGVGTSGRVHVDLLRGPTIGQGGVQSFHIWAQPSPDNGGYKQLENVSLNIVSSAALVDITEVFIFNPNNRFIRVVDSAFHDELNPELRLGNRSADEVRAGEPDHVLGLLASAGLGQPAGAGIGPECLAGDPTCTITNSGPAWRFASFRVALLEVGETDVFLEIGARGINHTGEFSNQTEVSFAPPSIENSPRYSAGPSGGRQRHDLAGEIADVRTTVIPPPAGDYNSDGRVSAADYTVWRDSLGQMGDALPADGNGDSTVDQADHRFWRTNFATVAALPGDYNGDGRVSAADYVVWRDSLGRLGDNLPADGDGSGQVDQVDYAFWRTNFGRQWQTVRAGGRRASGSGHAVPEPASIGLVLCAVAFAGSWYSRCRITPNSRCGSRELKPRLVSNRPTTRVSRCASRFPTRLW